MAEVNLRSKALYFLARREYAYKELFVKLGKYSTDKHAIKMLLDELVEKGYLSEERYLDAYINSKARNYGGLKIKAKLYQLVDRDKVDTALQNASIDEVAIIAQMWQRRFACEELNFKNYNKQFRHFINKGFNYNNIRHVLGLHYTNIFDY